MNPLSTLLLVAIAILTFALPRRLAPLPTLIGFCYMTMGQGLLIGPFNFHFYRLVLLIGVIRVIVKKENLAGGLNSIDKIVIVYSAWYIFASFFHDQRPGAGFIFSLGNIFNTSVAYFLFRVWCRTAEDTTNIIKLFGFILAPIALEMLYENITGINNFSYFGGVSPNVDFREGAFRANGPFRHAILAGTVGASCVPLFIGIWNKHRIASISGIISGAIMTYACASSGPIIALAVGIICMGLWKFRFKIMSIFWSAVGFYILIDLTSDRRGYHFLVENFAIVGGSTAYYRARLIDTALDHLNEWWLTGTDYTRHWIAPGLGSIIDAYHMDITNYYISIGVDAGLPAVLILFFLFWKCLKATSVYINSTPNPDEETYENTRVLWCFGASLSAFFVSGFSVAYFDQSRVVFWLTIAIVSTFLYLRTEPTETKP